MFLLLDRMGVSGPRAREARRVLVVYTIGFAAFAARSQFESRDLPDLPSTELLNNFLSGLRWLLAGIAGGSGAGGSAIPPTACSASATTGN
jgi:hypothetical protein